ncbi:MAG: ribonuclease HI [Alphaproteobacteria bacterium]|nr:ribonuclease HI [Alphaproteobacteria bacterium]
MKRVSIYTDGACSGNPGPGGWSAIIMYGNVEKEICGGEEYTTNNRMELTAAILALEALKEPCRIDLYTDSKYVKGGMTGWIDKWLTNNWKNADKEPVKNKELWMRLIEAAGRHEIQWHWIEGHSGHELNERADQLARSQCSKK